MDLSTTDFLNALKFSNLLWAAIIIGITSLVNYLLERILNAFSERDASWRLRVKSFVPIFRMLVWVFGFALASRVLFPEKEQFFALLGAVALAIALAIRETLANLIGGFLILFNRPFIVGDRVQIGEHYGEIVEVGLLTSRLQTPGDNRVTIPNAKVITDSVSNANAGVLHCQVQIMFYMSLDAPIDKARKIIHEAVLASPFLFYENPVVVNVRECYTETPYVEIKAKAYVFDARQEFSFMTDVTSRVKRAFSEEKFTRFLIDRA